MSFMIEVYLSRTKTELTEGDALRCAMQHGGLCTHRDSELERIELTIEFEAEPNAERAMEDLLGLGYYVEGPYDY